MVELPKQHLSSHIRRCTQQELLQLVKLLNKGARVLLTVVSSASFIAISLVLGADGIALIDRIVYELVVP